MDTSETGSSRAPRRKPLAPKNQTRSSPTISRAKSSSGIGKVPQNYANFADLSSARNDTRLGSFRTGSKANLSRDVRDSPNVFRIGDGSPRAHTSRENPARAHLRSSREREHSPKIHLSSHDRTRSSPSVMPAASVKARASMSNINKVRSSQMPRPKVPVPPMPNNENQAPLPASFLNWTHQSHIPHDRAKPFSLGGGIGIRTLDHSNVSSEPSIDPLYDLDRHSEEPLSDVAREAPESDIITVESSTDERFLEEKAPSPKNAWITEASPMTKVTSTSYDHDGSSQSQSYADYPPSPSPSLPQRADFRIGTMESLKSPLLSKSRSGHVIEKPPAVAPSPPRASPRITPSASLSHLAAKSGEAPPSLVPPKGRHFSGSHAALAHDAGLIPPWGDAPRAEKPMSTFATTSGEFTTSSLGESVALLDRQKSRSFASESNISRRASVQFPDTPSPAKNESLALKRLRSLPLLREESLNVGRVPEPESQSFTNTGEVHSDPAELQNRTLLAGPMLVHANDGNSSTANRSTDDETIAKLRRQIMDLEITRTSILAVSSMHEKAYLKQRKELRELRKAMNDPLVPLLKSNESQSHEAPDDPWHVLLESDPQFATVVSMLDLLQMRVRDSLDYDPASRLRVVQ